VDSFEGDGNEHRCPKTHQMGTLSFQFSEDVIKGFFHNAGTIGKPTLAMYFLVTFFVACITYGIAVPSGLFVPCILMGSAFGRLAGELMRDAFGPQIRPDIYALIGAAAMLSAVTRITITITVILFETTGQLFMITPIMGTVLVAKWVADLFNISLYDMHVELKCVPFVEPDPPKVMVGMLAGEVMTNPCRKLQEVQSVRGAIQLLNSCTHNGFAVVSNEGEHFRGLMGRNHLIKLLINGKYSVNGSAVSPGLLEITELTGSLQSKNLSLDPVLGLLQTLDDSATVDLRSYMNPATITVSPKCPIGRCYTLFRGMGIRHLPVVDDSNRVLGMITRKELMTDFAQDLY
jgi:chloride channel 7